MVAGRFHLQEKHTHSEYIVNSLLKDLAQTIVYNILFPAISEFLRLLLLRALPLSSFIQPRHTSFRVYVP